MLVEPDRAAIELIARLMGLLDVVPAATSEPLVAAILDAAGAPFQRPYAVADARNVLEQIGGALVAPDPLAGDVEPEPRCRVCGCTDDHACPGGCVWVDDSLCSACVPLALAQLQAIAEELGVEAAAIDDPEALEELVEPPGRPA